MKPILMDTSCIVALLDKSDRQHKSCVEAFTVTSRPLITCEAVISETCYLLRKIPLAAQAVMKNIETKTLGIPWKFVGNELRIAKLMKTYQKTPMDFADACLVCMAEDFKTDEILTLDSDFEYYRWSKNKTFNLLVEKER